MFKLKERYRVQSENSYNEAFMKFVVNKSNWSDIKGNSGLLARVYDWFKTRTELDLTQTNNVSLPTKEEDRFKVLVYETAENGIDRMHWRAPTMEYLIKEFANDYQNIIPGHRLQNVVVLIRDKRSHISLDKYLTSFYLDKLRTRHMLYKKANKALYAAVLELSHDARMNVRRCEDPACRCHDSYDKLNIDDAEKLFLP